VRVREGASTALSLDTNFDTSCQGTHFKSSSKMVLFLLFLLFPIQLGQAADDENERLHFEGEAGAEDQCKLLLDKFSNSSSEFTSMRSQS